MGGGGDRPKVKRVEWSKGVRLLVLFCRTIVCRGGGERDEMGEDGKEAEKDDDDGGWGFSNKQNQLVTSSDLLLFLHKPVFALLLGVT